MKLKRGVSINGIQPELVVGMMVVDHVYRENGYELTVTSVTDGEHKTGSLHYAGLAFDCRTWLNSSGEQWSPMFKQNIADEIQRALGSDWDVVVEATHIHVEFDVR